MRVKRLFILWIRIKWSWKLVGPCLFFIMKRISTIGELEYGNWSDSGCTKYAYIWVARLFASLTLTYTNAYTRLRLCEPPWRRVRSQFRVPCPKYHSASSVTWLLDRTQSPIDPNTRASTHPPCICALILKILWGMKKVLLKFRRNEFQHF